VLSGMMGNPKRRIGEVPMDGYAEVVFCLPGAAAGKLGQLARQQNSTIDGYVATVVEEWLEQRRKDVRLGRKNRALSDLRVAAADGHKVDR
jgi:hypothetical protein